LRPAARARRRERKRPDDSNCEVRTPNAVASPIYRPTRETTFSAKLIDPSTGRTLWVGNGDVKAGGKLFVGDETSASKAASAILEDLKAKHVVLGGVW
jgi:hypothetical protein